MNLHTRRIYNHAGYDVTMYFRSEVIGVRKWAESFISYAVMYASQVAMHFAKLDGLDLDEVMEDVDSEEAGKRHRRLMVSLVSITK